MYVIISKQVSSDMMMMQWDAFAMAGALSYKAAEPYIRSVLLFSLWESTDRGSCCSSGQRRGNWSNRFGLMPTYWTGFMIGATIEAVQPGIEHSTIKALGHSLVNLCILNFYLGS